MDTSFKFSQVKIFIKLEIKDRLYSKRIFSFLNLYSFEGGRNILRYGPKGACGLCNGLVQNGRLLNWRFSWRDLYQIMGEVVCFFRGGWLGLWHRARQTARTVTSVHAKRFSHARNYVHANQSNHFKVELGCSLR